MNNTGITQVNITDVPNILTEVKYFDGEIGFADNIQSVKVLRNTFKVNFLAMIFCTRGNLSLKINSTPYHMSTNDGMLIDMQSVVSDITHDDEMSCKIICMTLEGGITFIAKHVFETFLKVKEDPIVHFSDDAMELMSKYYELALFKIEHPEVGSKQKEVMHNILRAYVLDLIANVTSKTDENMQILRQADKIFQRFVVSLASNAGVQRSVKDYASELCVSPKYLSSICSKIEGKTASELITINTVGRIKQLLLYSPLSIKEISTQMGFDNLSFFGKYVKKHLGLSPNNYRKQQGYGK